MNWKCVAALGLCLMACLPLDASAANLVSNGSFENPGGGNLVPNPPGISAFYITGWEVYTGDIDYIPPSTWTASDGVMSLDLYGFNPGGIRQTITTVTGETYNVTFDMAANPSGNIVKTLRVSAAGSDAQFTSDRKDRRKLGWEEKTWSFVAISTSTVLSFESFGPHTANAGPALDNVRVSPPPPPCASANVSPGEFAGFTLVYDLAIPNNLGTGPTGSPPYTTDNSGSITPGSFDRIAYFLKLDDGNGPQFIWVSMDPFTTDPTKIGVPTLASSAVF